LEIREAIGLPGRVRSEEKGGMNLKHPGERCSNESMADKRIVFYDGQCGLCIGWVRFVIDRDGNDHFRFASLQSAWSKAFFEARGLGAPDLNSVAVWNGNDLLRKSEAIAEIAAHLGGAWQLGKHLMALPESVRDGAYTYIARNRHQWFKQKRECWLPKPEYRRKFLDLEAAGSKNDLHACST
jgi:predicted DCC family thiol-disulfide oxidoreductase YuxK